MNVWDASESFDLYLEARYTSLLRFAHVLCGDPHLAGDLVHDALERVGLAWRRIRRRDNPDVYVRRAIVNTYLNRLRRLRRERLVPQIPDTAAKERDTRDEALWQLLGTLPRQQRAVIVLRYYEDLTEAETAAVLGCSVGTVKSTGARAMAKLRASFSAPSNHADRGAK